jgi:hypothetical protein
MKRPIAKACEWFVLGLNYSPLGTLCDRFVRYAHRELIARLCFHGGEFCIRSWINPSTGSLKQADSIAKA